MSLALRVLKLVPSICPPPGQGLSDDEGPNWRILKCGETILQKTDIIIYSINAPDSS